jgi:hypothetical protein
MLNEFKISWLSKPHLLPCPLRKEISLSKCRTWSAKNAWSVIVKGKIRTSFKARSKRI